MISLLLHLALALPPAPLPAPPAIPSDTARFWGGLGHRVVALLAAERLSPAARREVDRLLEGESMADVASWADQVRNNRPATGPWHYVNIPVIDSVYRPAVVCPRGCVISAIDSLTGVLRDRTRSTAQRAEALRFVIHFVGDLHQPLHAGDRGDRGGNDVTLRFLGRQTNLHSLWDSGLLTASGVGEAALVETLRGRIAERKDLAALAGGSVQAWAMESHDLSRDVIYAHLPASLVFGDEEVVRTRPVLEEALLRAGVRLAALLETALGTPAK